MKFLKIMTLVATSLSAATVSAATATGNSERGEFLEGFEKVLWFDVNGSRHWLAEQPARGDLRGCVLLLASDQTGANGRNHLTTLRHALPEYGWHTFFVNVPRDDSTQAVVAAATAQLPVALERVIFVCEGASCLDMPEGSNETITGSVFINVPLQDGSRVDSAVADRWRSFAPPGLILQEYPRGWPQTLTVAADFELHLLPVGHEGRQNSRVLRTLRGWLKRRLSAG